MQLRIIFKALTQHFGGVSFFVGDSQKLSTEVETMPYISGENSFTQHFSSNIFATLMVSIWGKQTTTNGF